MIKSEPFYGKQKLVDTRKYFFDSEKWSIRNNRALLNDLFLTIKNKKLINYSNTVITSNHIEVNNKLNSMFFSKKDSYIKIKDDNYFDFGVEDFTIDWWEYNLTSCNKKQQLIDKRNNNNITMLVENTNYKTFSASSDGVMWDIAQEIQMGSIQNNKWAHWAVIKSNNTFYAFKNGTITNKWYSKNNINIPSDVITIGSNKNNTFYGYINKFRVLRNTALWVEEFKLTTDELFY